MPVIRTRGDRTRATARAVTGRRVEPQGARPAPAARTPSAHPPGIEGALAAAALLHKSADRGAEALVTPAHVERVRAVFARAADTDALTALLTEQTGPGAAVARALLLRAIAVRSASLIAGGERAAAARAALVAFSAQARPLAADELLRRATVLDLDPSRNTSVFDPQQLWRTQGTVRDSRGLDASTDNDGLFQRFTGSCGPTTLQMMLAEADPVMAFAIHDAGLTSDATDDAVAGFQRAVLEEYGGGRALGRTESFLRARVRNGLARLVRGGEVTPAQRDALDAFLFSRGADSAAAREALAVVRRAWGVPSDAEIERLRRAPLPKADQGMSNAALVSLLNDRHAAALGARYAERFFARGHAWRHLDDVAAALRRGLDVPFGTSEPAHWMLLSAVRGRKPHRHFLASDPDGGRTAWVAERDLVRGDFLTGVFKLPRPGQRPYVDTFIVPERT